MTGDLVYSTSTGEKSVVVTVPVKRNGKVVGGLGASVSLDDLSQRINAALALPENLLFYTLASDGTITLNGSTRLNFADPKAQKSKSLTRAVDKMLSTAEGEVTYECGGITRYVIYRTSALMGWKFAVGISRVDARPAAVNSRGMAPPDLQSGAIVHAALANLTRHILLPGYRAPSNETQV